MHSVDLLNCSPQELYSTDIFVAQRQVEDEHTRRCFIFLNSYSILIRLSKSVSSLQAI